MSALCQLDVCLRLGLGQAHNLALVTAICLRCAPFPVLLVALSLWQLQVDFTRSLTYWLLNRLIDVLARVSNID